MYNYFFNDKFNKNSYLCIIYLYATWYVQCIVYI